MYPNDIAKDSPFWNYLLFQFFLDTVAVLVAQSCLTLCDPWTVARQALSVHGILQARILKWVAIPFSRGSSQPRDRTQVSCMASRFFTIWIDGSVYIIDWASGQMHLQNDWILASNKTRGLERKFHSYCLHFFKSLLVCSPFSITLDSCSHSFMELLPGVGVSIRVLLIFTTSFHGDYSSLIRHHG